MRTKQCGGIFCVALLLITWHASAQQISPAANQPAPATPVTQWPQRLDSPDGAITVYQPQPTQFEGDTLTARAAVSLAPPGATDPEFGAMWFSARVFTDRDARTVTIQDVTIKQVKLPGSNPDQEKQFGQVVAQRVPSMNLQLSLDQLEATLGVVQKEKEEAAQLNNTPPKIIFATTPTTLVVLDGAPKLQATQTQGVMAVVNTPFILLLDMASKQYYLKAGDTWMVAADVTGPYAPAGAALPPGVLDAGSKLAAQSASTPPQATPQSSGPTQVVVAEEPTELISTAGQPQYAPIVGNDLLYLTNSDADAFIDVSSQENFVLLSGRWYESKSLQGPWIYVPSDKLPASFAQIPADSPKANVLASIAGTQSAKDARMDAFIPQTTAIQRDSAANLNVAYDGQPQFVPVENTSVTYASNCADPVLCVGGGYYCCHQAVWYRAGAARGPWALCDSVPQEIYTLPPNCPVYNCRYVYVYDSTPTEVYCGYLPGYTGSYVYGGTIVYGTGYNYPAWYQTQFIPRPYTWGFGARYDYHAGEWGYGRGDTVGQQWFAARPAGHDWFGPQGYVDYRNLRVSNERDVHTRVINNNTHVEEVTATRINLYNRQENARRNRGVRAATPAVEPARPSTPSRELPAAQNNVFVGQDGQIYRHTDTGWEAHGKNGWSAYQSTPNQIAPNEPTKHIEETPSRVHSEMPAGNAPRARNANASNSIAGCPRATSACCRDTNTRASASSNRRTPSNPPMLSSLRMLSSRLILSNPRVWSSLRMLSSLLILSNLRVLSSLLTLSVPRTSKNPPACNRHPAVFKTITVPASEAIRSPSSPAPARSPGGGSVGGGAGGGGSFTGGGAARGAGSGAAGRH